MRQNIIIITGLTLLSGMSIAQSIPVAPQPTACIDSKFLTMPFNKYASGQTVALTITNHCGQAVDLQNASITFLNSRDLNSTFWGNFSPLSYPSNADMRITSQPSNGQYLSTLSLQYASGSNPHTSLPNGSAFTIYYTVKQASYVEGSTKVYLNSAVNTGNIRIISNTNQPENVSEFYTLVNVSLNGETISIVPLPWSGEQLISGLAPGDYDISPVNINSDDEDHRYEGSGPGKLTVTSGETTSAIVSYTEKLVLGSIRFQLPTLPEALAGYEEKPKITLIRDDNHSAQISDLEWGAISDTPRLDRNEVSYHFSAQDINYNGFSCTPSFEPATVAATNIKPLVSLTYSCVKTSLNNVNLHISGAPSELSTVTVTFIPNGKSEPISETIALIDGEGSSTLAFTAGTIYTITADELEGYSISYSAQLLTVNEGAEETIVYSKMGTQPEPEVVTEPETTEPVVVDVTEPESVVVTEPETTEPVVVDVTEPESVVVTEPETTEPVVVDVKEPEPVVVTEPETTEPVVVDVKEPEPVVVAEPETTEPVVVDVKEPELVVVTEPETTEPVVVDVKEPEPEVVTEPETTEPVVVDVKEPEPVVVTEPETTEPVVVDVKEPEPVVVTEPETTEPVVVDVKEPEPVVVTEPETTEPVVVDVTEPEPVVVTEPETTEPVVVDVKEPEPVVVAEPETTEPVVVDVKEPEPVVVTEPEAGTTSEVEEK